MSLFIQWNAIIIKDSVQNVIVAYMTVRHRVQMVGHLIRCHRPVFIILGIEPLYKEAAINQHRHLDRRKILLSVLIHKLK